jgi:arsenate reductase
LDAGADRCRVARIWDRRVSGHFFKARRNVIVIYGIRNCDTMKKARAWLEARKIAYRFHDYKADGVEKPRLEYWASQLGWEALLNRAGTTFRKLPEADRSGVTEKKAIALMLAQPSMIKRPILEKGGKIAAGFRPEQYEKLLGR